MPVSKSFYTNSTSGGGVGCLLIIFLLVVNCIRFIAHLVTLGKETSIVHFKLSVEYFLFL